MFSSKISDTQTPQYQQTEAKQVNNPKEDFSSMNKSLFDYSAYNKDGSADGTGKATVSYGDFSDEELNQTNSNNVTFSEAISSLIGKSWIMFGPIFENSMQIFSGSSQNNNEEIVNGHKVGERNGDSVWCNDGQYHKANDSYVKDGITYTVNGNLAIIATGNCGVKTEYFKDGYRVTEDNGDNEYTVKVYQYKNGAILENKADLDSLKSENNLVYEVDKYNNGAAGIRKYNSENVQIGSLRNTDGIPKYYEK